jgi:heme exporter protein A
MDLGFSYPTQDTPFSSYASLFQPMSWQLPEGSILHIQGPNGSGKTTLLRCLAGMLRPTSGCIRYDGEDIETQRVRYQQGLCYVGHKTGITPALSVLENCLYDLKRSQQCEDLEKLLKETGLWALRHVPCSLLSAGQKRRVGLLRLRLSVTQLWLLDEPLVALDTAGVSVLTRWLQNHLITGGQVVYASHQPLPELEAYHQVYSLC